MLLDLARVSYALETALTRCDPKLPTTTPAGCYFGAYIVEKETSTTMAELLRDALNELKKARCTEIVIDDGVVYGREAGDSSP